jgi:hypothetical protein
MFVLQTNKTIVMPWKVEKRPIKSSNKDYAILKKEGGSWKTVGRSTSRKKAKESVQARAAGSHNK